MPARGALPYAARQGRSFATRRDAPRHRPEGAGKAEAQASTTVVMRRAQTAAPQMPAGERSRTRRVKAVRSRRGRDAPRHRPARGAGKAEARRLTTRRYASRAYGGAPDAGEGSAPVRGASRPFVRDAAGTLPGTDPKGRRQGRSPTPHHPSLCVARIRRRPRCRRGERSRTRRVKAVRSRRGRDAPRHRPLRAPARPKPTPPATRRYDVASAYGGAPEAGEESAPVRGASSPFVRDAEGRSPPPTARGAGKTDARPLRPLRRGPCRA